MLDSIRYFTSSVCKGKAISKNTSGINRDSEVSIIMVKTFGSLKMVEKDNSRYWEIKGHQPVIMISRIIYGLSNDENGAVFVPHHKTNLEHIEWLMMRYPLEIKGNGEWKDALKELSEMRKKMEQIADLKPIEPKGSFRGKLMPFQKEGLDFLLKTSGQALLADEMGLGKTVQTLAYLCTDQHTLPALVVAPLVTLWNWQNEIEKFMVVKSLKGMFKNRDLKPRIVLIRDGKQKKLPEADFYITNYEMLSKRVDDLQRVGIQSVIADEIQNLRNKDTEKYKAVNEVTLWKTIKHKIGLSGTPIYNRGSEIYPIVNLLQTGCLGEYSEFLDMYCYENGRGQFITDEEKRSALAEKLTESIMLRRRKDEVLKDLPPKIRYKEIIDIDEEEYQDSLDRIWAKMEEAQKKAKTAFEKTNAYEKAINEERISAGIAKLPHVVSFVEQMMEIDEPVVVFCHHREMHRLLNERLVRYYPATIIGGQTDKVRQENISKFQEGKTKLLIAGLRAGNLGINLVQSSYVIHAELDWTPAIHRQAEDRLHRIGQTRKVFSYYLIGNGTMDDNVAKVLVDKTLEIDAVMGDKPQDQDETKAKQIVEEIRKRLRKKPKRNLLGFPNKLTEMIEQRQIFKEDAFESQGEC
jgi:SNF2 family DNA or RNA helicase